MPTHYLSFFLSTLLFISLARSRSVPIGTETPILYFDWSSNTNPPISLVGDVTLTHSSLRLAHPFATVIYNNTPINFVGRNHGFSTHFSFSFSSIPGNGTQLSFFLVPTNVESIQLGLPPSSILVQLVSLMGQSGNKTESFLKIIVGAHFVAQSSSGLISSTDSIKTHDGEKLNCWVEYNGVSKRMQVRVSKSTISMMSTMLSYPVDLTQLLSKHKYFAGIRYSCENSGENVNIFSWSFSVENGANLHRMHSEPLDPDSVVVKSIEDHPKVNHSHSRMLYYWGVLIIMLVAGAACGSLMMWYNTVSTWKTAASTEEASIGAGYQKMFMFEGGHVKGYLELEDME